MAVDITKDDLYDMAGQLVAEALNSVDDVVSAMGLLDVDQDTADMVLDIYRDTHIEVQFGPFEDEDDDILDDPDPVDLIVPSGEAQDLGYLDDDDWAEPLHDDCAWCGTDYVDFDEDDEP